ncbi:MAG: phenylacetate--CoA ligase family protein [PVC group bacterium]|nr:phenylacetate--CoA ligase family protein [PVC group bacterium]
MYDKFVKYIYFPLIQAIKGQKVLGYLQKLEKTQWESLNGLKNKQWGELKKLLKTVDKNVPYYKQLFKDKGIDVENIKDYADFQQIPCLGKEQVRQNFNQLINRNYGGDFYKTKTSGSMGLSLELFISADMDSWIYAGQQRAQKWFGVEVGDRALFVWGRPLNSLYQEIIGNIKARLKNIMLVSAFELSDAPLEKHWQRIKKFKPKYIYGYASSVFKIAEYVQKIGQQEAFSCKAVFTTAETLFSSQAQVIKEAFGCPVVQEYGCAEVGAFGYECPEGNMHVFSENVFVEVLRDGEPVTPGETGEIVVTSLHNYCMPFIRYRVGDLGSFLDDECACGRKLPLLDIKIAKVTDMVVTSKGEVFSSELFDYINLELIKQKISGIGQFRVTQENPDTFTVEIVKQDPFSEGSTELFRKRMKEFLGDNIKVEFIFKDEILRDKSGKMRYFISKLNQNAK